MEQRFDPGFLETPSDKPGLVLSGGVVYVVAADGTRSEVGGGAEFPPEWTVGGDGDLTIAPTTGPHALELVAPESSSANFVNGWHYGQADEASVLVSALNGATQVSLYEGTSGRGVSLNVGSELNAIQVETGDGTVHRVTPDGYPIVMVHSAPADGDLAAGECAIWFDQTNGAAKLMLKAKQADGTVKTGSVNVQT